MVEMIKPRKSSCFTASVMLSLLALLFAGVTPAQAASGNSPKCGPSQYDPWPVLKEPCWWWVKANQDVSGGVTGVWSSMTVEQPNLGQLAPQAFVDLTHSVTAMHIATTDKKTGELVDGVEVGWAVAPGVYQLSAEPHLFAFPLVNGKQPSNCWPHPDWCGWVPAPGATHHLGETLQAQHGVEHVFGIHYVGGNWQVIYDQQMIGWFDGATWNHSFTKGTRLSWYGEVETNGRRADGKKPGCAEMGNGVYGTQPDSAKIGSMGYWTSSGVFTWAHPTVSNVTGNANFYNMGNHLNASWMTYGGPGGYTDGNGVDHACA